MKLRVVIADDEPLGRERLRLFLQTEPHAEIVAECRNGIEAVEAIRKTSPDLVFLDVKMPELDGFGVLEALADIPLPAIVFVTAYDQFAVRAFEANAVDYLLKPFDRERFEMAFRRAHQRLQHRPKKPTQTKNHLLSDVLASLQANPTRLERLTVKSGKRITIVKTADIDWLRAADNYTELHVGNATHLLRLTIGALAAQLPTQFVRISRSILVNLTRIAEIRSKSHGDCLVILEDGTQLTASRSHRPNLLRLLNNQQ
ncbi:MAG TPA: LytTR family DNA-binding domain-containing protein [Verrucomicrobiae bacterium]|nr:LytTR family DNA-binding domain-containing protein [Verrucomicrobiae bacterium]